MRFINDHISDSDNPIPIIGNASSRIVPSFLLKDRSYQLMSDYEYKLFLDLLHDYLVTALKVSKINPSALSRATD